jgi:hypothetical protein
MKETTEPLSAWPDWANFRPGLPDFSWHNVNRYQMANKCAKWTWNIPNVRKIYQTDINYSSIFHCKTLQNWPKSVFLILKYTICQTCFRLLNDLFNGGSFFKVTTGDTNFGDTFSNVGIMYVLLRQKMGDFFHKLKQSIYALQCCCKNLIFIVIVLFETKWSFPQIRKMSNLIYFVQGRWFLFKPKIPILVYFGGP